MKPKAAVVMGEFITITLHLQTAPLVRNSGKRVFSPTVNLDTYVHTGMAPYLFFFFSFFGLCALKIV